MNIDYYHHCEAAPPNFDEPCYYEKELTGYCYPIHSLYHTTDDNWNPLNHHIPTTFSIYATKPMNIMPQIKS